MSIYRKKPPRVLYFIQGVGGGPIKIGYTCNVRRRLTQLQIGSPIRLMILATAPFRLQSERDIHRRFKSHRLDGEWFSPCQELIDLIQHFAS